MAADQQTNITVQGNNLTHLCYFLTSGLSRPLCGMESLFQQMDSIRVLTFVVKIRLTKKIEIPNKTIIEALKIWQEQNPSLKVKIEKKISNDWFVPHKQNIPFEEISAKCWEDEFEKWAQKPLSREMPFKVRRVSGIPECFVLLFKMDHSLIDGSSRVRVLMQLIDIINDLLNEKKPQAQKLNSHKLLPDRDYFIHDANIYPTRTKFLINCIWFVPRAIRHWISLKLFKFNPENNDQQKLYEMFSSSSKENKSTTGSSFLCIGQDQVSKLVKVARSQQVTIYGLMTAALKTTIDNIMKDKPGFDVNDLQRSAFNRVMTTIGLRRFFKDQVPNDYLGFYGTVVTQNVVSSDSIKDKSGADSFWNFARSYSQDLHQRLDHEIKNILSSVLWFDAKCNLGKYIFLIT